MNRFWVIDDSKKVVFWKKVSFYFLIKLFLHTFCKKRTFCYQTTFIESLITHKRFIFKESYISYGKRQKSCTLIVIMVKCLYLTSPIFNSLAKSNRNLPGRKYINILLHKTLKQSMHYNSKNRKFRQKFTFTKFFLDKFSICFEGFFNSFLANLAFLNLRIEPFWKLKIKTLHTHFMWIGL